MPPVCSLVIPVSDEKAVPPLPLRRLDALDAPADRTAVGDAAAARRA